MEPDAALLAGLHDQSLRLGRIVDDLAALSAAEASALSLRWADVDLAALARSEIAAQEPQLRAAGLVVHVHASEPVLVRGDADRLRQVLANLLSNAARYCRAGDAVYVAVLGTPGRPGSPCGTPGRASRPTSFPTCSIGSGAGRRVTDRRGRVSGCQWCGNW